MILYSNILGEGSPFVILHGFLGMGDNWKTLGKQFTELGYQVHLVDQRNHGRSFHHQDFSYEVMAEDLLNYCDTHNLKEVVLLGHSMGGKTAMEFATRFRELVSKLIVADIAPKPYPSHHQEILKALRTLDFERIKSRGDANEALSRYIMEDGVRMFLLKNLYRAGQERYALRMNLDVLTQKIEEIGKGLPEDQHYDGPTLFIHGGNSGYLEPADDVLIKKHFPLAQIREIPGAGHWLHAEKPTQFFEIVRNFL